MNQYMADIELPGTITDEFASLIPFQRARVNMLMFEGKISSYSLSMDRSRLWVVVNAASEDDAHGVIVSFPIFHFVRVTMHELMFHNSVRLLDPQFSLN
jgi:hypothetical protein